MNNIKLFILVLFLLLVSACSSIKSSDIALQREWKLIEMNGYQKEDLFQKDLTLNLKDDNYLKSKCLNSEVLVNKKSNLLKIELKQKNKGLEIFSCSEIERVFVQTIMDTESYEVNGHFLTLNLKGNKTLKFIAADWD